MQTPLKVLFVEDSEVDAELTTAELKRGGFLPTVQRVETRDDMERALREDTWDLIICDYLMPRFSAEAALDTLKATGKDLPFIIASGAVTAEDAVSLLRKGAHDFMNKNALARLVPAIERELREADVREQGRQAEAQVDILSQAVQHSPVSVMITNPAGEIEYVNPFFEKASGYSSAEAKGRNLGFTLQNENHDHLMTQISELVSKSQQWGGEMCNIRADGELFWENVKVSPLMDSNNCLSHYIVVKEDITVRRNYEQQLVRQAHYDDLTGMANRALMIERLTQALQQADQHQHQVAVLGIDLDDFKNVNDSVGHTYGDTLLKEAAQRLSRCIRSGDTVARMGGDEFEVVLSYVTDPNDVAQMAQRIVQQFSKPFCIDDREYSVTCSVGIALYPENGNNPHQLVRNADLAMYQSKDMGRNQYQFFTEDINQRLIDRLELESKLRKVVDNNELVLHYQPIYDVTTKKIAGFEALVRWTQADGKLKMPDNFIPVAENIGVIREIDSWVLATACRDTGALLRNGNNNLRLAINISPIQLEVEGYAEFVMSQLEANQLQPHHLELEITERVLVTDAETTDNNIKALAEYGIRMSVDDFGTGYSSLGYLQRYPLHTLKIDRSFVLPMDSNADARRLVETILLMAHGLGMDVVAEGVENEEQYELLREMGCQEAQGYLLSRPVSLEEIQRIVTLQNRPGSANIRLIK
ncbi:MAG: EAL domain-containing protein [Oceanicoccus sp.]